MPQLSRHPMLLSEMLAFDKTGALQVVIETPKGSSNKYDYDPACDCFQLAKVLPEGMTFPYDFGFIPSTIGDDGDPIDILVLMDFPAMPGCRLSARLIGAIQAKQSEKRNWIRNDRLIAVAEFAREHSGVHKLKDLRPHLLDEIKEFFVEYNKQKGRKFKPIGDCGTTHALKLVHQGAAKFKKAKSTTQE
jgi:inorganic pyrophosphatase